MNEDLKNFIDETLKLDFDAMTNEKWKEVQLRVENYTRQMLDEAHVIAKKIEQLANAKEKSEKRQHDKLDN